MNRENPFASYLSVRQPTEPVSPLSRSRLLKSTLSSVSKDDSLQTATFGPPNVDRLELSSAVSLDIEENPFSTYLSLRPSPTDDDELFEPPEPTQLTVEEHLRQEILKTKKQLLEVALDTELRFSDPEAPEETALRLRRLKKAQTYLLHPDHALEILSGSEEQGDVEAKTAFRQSRDRLTLQRPLADTASYRTERRWSVASVHRIPPPDLLQQLPTKGVSQTWTGSWRQEDRMHPGGWSKDDLSVPSVSDATLLRTLRKEERTMLGTKGRLTNSTPDFARSSDVTLPPIDASILQQTSSRAVEQAEEPTLSAWWSKRRCWNVFIAKKDLAVSRRYLECAGGAVVMGDGKIPVFRGGHLLSTGHYYSFQIDAIDEEHFPLGASGDLSFAFGISHLPARDRQCDKHMYGYEIPGCVLVGYGSHIIDAGQWYIQQTWDPNELKQGDVVGVLINPHGDMLVYVNNKQVLRFATSLCDGNKQDMNPRRKTLVPPRTIYPIIDLHGRVSAVTLLPKAILPNLKLVPRNPIIEKELNPWGQKGKVVFAKPGRSLAGDGKHFPEKLTNQRKHGDSC
eukprot:TRINITY_DN46037_c0_g1_i1.p1 TRINITY_DN46037_c0_g1~~TRINITY_DN46037_c0_g1_i1.p1  ORF type:complete len:568 (-),score=63.21 TRINITY_DN46037_c0_g1_i1:263-1966(-)